MFWGSVRVDGGSGGGEAALGTVGGPWRCGRLSGEQGFQG